MSAAEHPAPDRRRAGPGILLASLCAGPVGWIVQLLAAYGVAGLVCAPRGVARLVAPPGWAWDKPILTTLNFACLALALLGGAIAFRSWSATRREKAGAEAALLEIGEGRTRFLAACGLMSAFGFGVAILFNTVEFFTVPACWGGAS